MEYVKLGNTGMDVSRLCVGCMSFGETTRGNSPWFLNEDASRDIIRRALELGIFFLIQLISIPMGRAKNLSVEHLMILQTAMKWS